MAVQVRHHELGKPPETSLVNRRPPFTYFYLLQCRYVGLVGTIIVGVGSCISCLDVAPMILQAVAADGVVPGLQACRPV